VAFNARMKKLEAGLETRKRVFAWLEQSKASGGFLEYWRQRLMGPLVPHAWLADSEAFFLYVLVNKVNLAALSCAIDNEDVWRFAAVALRSLIADPRQLPREELVADWRGLFSALLERGLALEAAAASIATDYFDEHAVLFADSAAMLNTYTSRLLEIAEIYDGVADQIDLRGFSNIPSSAAVEENVRDLVNGARAIVIADGGDLSSAVSLLMNVVRIH
jgi:hypothetical protein